MQADQGRAHERPLDAARQRVVCPNCGAEQLLRGLDARCESCGHLLENVNAGPRQQATAAMPGQADPLTVPAPMASGGIGGDSDGTQVTHRATSAVPGKPMAPIAEDPAGSSTLEGQAMDTPAREAHAERGGSG